MKTYMFEGKEYIESDEDPRLPKEGEIYLSDEGCGVLKAHFNFSVLKRKILIPREEKKMNEYSEEEMKALDGSIEKWDKISKGKLVDEGVYNCPLCTLHTGPGQGCSDCIVCKETKRAGCIGISYPIWKEHIEKEHKPYTYGNVELKVYCPECKQIAEEIRDSLYNIKDNILKRTKEKYYIRIENPKTAIGEGDIQIIVVDKNENRVRCENVIYINREGEACLSWYINEDVGLKSDENNFGTIKVNK